MSAVLKSILVLVTLISLVSCQSIQKQINSQDTNISTQSSNLETIVYEPSEKNNGKIMGYIGGYSFSTTSSKGEDITLYNPKKEELSLLKSIMKHSGLAANFKFFGSDIDNTTTTIINNQRYILYNPNFLSQYPSYELRI